jgi:hypothetical protein
MVGAGLKVDGVLTLWSLSDVARQVGRTGLGIIHLSPALAGTPVAASGHWQKREASNDSFSWNEKGQSVTTASDESTFEWVPGGDGLELGSNKHVHDFVPWVVKKVGKLEKTILDLNKQGRASQWTDGNGVANCASLPMKWDYDNGRSIEQMRHPERGTWQMGMALTPLTVLGLDRGTVIATFNRNTGIYQNNTSGNHTAIFLSYYGETDPSGKFTATGIWVLEQGPRWPIRGRQIPFDSEAVYHSDAGRFNVVKICESHSPKLPF